MMGFGYGAMGLVWVLGIGILVIVIIGLLFLYRALRQSRPPDLGVTAQNALDILNNRYAKGEISDEEYNMKKSKLMK